MGGAWHFGEGDSLAGVVSQEWHINGVALWWRWGPVLPDPICFCQIGAVFSKMGQSECRNCGNPKMHP